jgi:hypothetical protein
MYLVCDVLRPEGREHFIRKWRLWWGGLCPKEYGAYSRRRVKCMPVLFSPLPYKLLELCTAKGTSVIHFAVVHLLNRINAFYMPII